MKKDFSGILLLSDYDGTLSWGGVPEKNTEALKYFMSCGGMFSLSTGRSGEGILKDKAMPILPNVPMVGLTGSQLYDLQKAECVWSECIAKEMACHIAKEMELTNATSAEIVFSGRSSVAHSPDEVEPLVTEPVMKVVVFTELSVWDAPVPEAASEYAKDRFEICSNGPGSFELTAIGVNKGSAAQKLKELTGAKTLICVGDYNGDNSMLIAADIGYAVANAQAKTKAVADRITEAQAKDGAIAEIIEKL